MFEVQSRFLDPATLVAASPSDLSLAILAGIVRIVGPRASWNQVEPRFLPMSNLTTDVVTPWDGPQVRAAAADAIGWLRSHDLITEYYSRGSVGGPTVVPTRLGYEINGRSSQPGAAAFAMRAVDLLALPTRTTITAALVSGDYDVAILQAFKAVEIRMRERAALRSSDFGSRLARLFFQKVSGTDLQRADRPGDMSDEQKLFVALFGMYRDRAGHERPHVDSIEYALEVIVSARHLLRIVEAATIANSV